MPDEAYAAAQALWEKYRVLTHELMKFIDEEEIETFIDLVDQREHIVEMLRELPSDPYRAGTEWAATKVSFAESSTSTEYSVHEV